ncbi:MAG: hypothetical protein ACK56F_18925, partial [bacterium]
ARLCAGDDDACHAGADIAGAPAAGVVADVVAKQRVARRGIGERGDGDTRHSRIAAIAQQAKACAVVGFESGEVVGGEGAASAAACQLSHAAVEFQRAGGFDRGGRAGRRIDALRGRG